MYSTYDEINIGDFIITTDTLNNDSYYKEGCIGIVVKKDKASEIDEIPYSIQFLLGEREEEVNPNCNDWWTGAKDVLVLKKRER